MTNSKKTKIWTYFFWPLVFVGICWIIAIYDYLYGINYKQGVSPRELKGLFGIFSSPFLHKDFPHLISNSPPLILLGSALFFFYKNLPYQVLWWLYFGGGTWLWCFGRDGNHIGASGLVYGLFSFVLIGGIISKNKNLMAISLLTIFIYGSMIWGVFPLDESVSWEGHLSSLLWGIILAFFYKKYIPSTPLYPLNDENSINEIKFGPDYWKTENQLQTNHFDENTFVTYHYKAKPKDNNKEEE